MYQCEATSVTGFIQQLACAYVRSGYVRVACGVLPAGKDAARFDAKQVERYRLDDMTARMRWKRRREGLANIQYLRHGRVFAILASDGHHDTFEQEEGRIVRDLRERPMIAFGYSLRSANGHVQVRIAEREYREFADVVLLLARRDPSPDKIAKLFRRLPFESYAPVRAQLFGLLAAVNQERKRSGRELVSLNVVRKQRRIVRPFAGSTARSADGGRRWRHDGRNVNRNRHCRPHSPAAGRTHDGRPRGDHLANRPLAHRATRRSRRRCRQTCRPRAAAPHRGTAVEVCHRDGVSMRRERRG